MNNETLNGLKKLFESYENTKLSVKERKSIVQTLKKEGFSIPEISDITKINRGLVYQMAENKQYPQKPHTFDFYSWLEEGFQKIKADNIPLSHGQKMQLDVLILKLKRIRGVVK